LEGERKLLSYHEQGGDTRGRKKKKKKERKKEEPLSNPYYPLKKKWGDLLPSWLAGEKRNRGQEIRGGKKRILYFLLCRQEGGREKGGVVSVSSAGKGKRYLPLRKGKKER